MRRGCYEWSWKSRWWGARLLCKELGRLIALIVSWGISGHSPKNSLALNFFFIYLILKKVCHTFPAISQMLVWQVLFVCRCWSGGGARETFCKLLMELINPVGKC